MATKKTNQEPNEPQEEVLTIEQRAEQLFATGHYKELWSNLQGQFFTMPERGESTLQPGETLTHHKAKDND